MKIILTILFALAALPSPAREKEKCDYNGKDVPVGNNGVSLYQGKPVNGIVCDYYENRIVIARIPYKNGMQDGLAKSYFKNGKLSLETPYKNGKAEGVGKEYYESGQLQSEIPYKNGIKDGVVKKYNRNGKVTESLEFKSGDVISGKCYNSGNSYRPLTEEEIESYNLGADWDCK